VPSHRADTAGPALRPRNNRSSRSAGSQRRSTASTSSNSGSPRRPIRKPGSSLSAPQVGIAGALGIATIAAPLTGAMGAQMPKAQVNPISSTVSAVSTVAFPNTANAAGVGVAALKVVPTEITVTTSAPKLLAAPKTVIVDRASRSGERSVLPGCDGVPTSLDAPNGQLPDSALCTLWDPAHRLRADAAVALAKLNIAYKQHFGENICITDSYRNLAQQYSVRARKPTLAAIPGTSNHGLGLAVDLGCGVETGSGNTRYQWLVDNASAYGWGHPAWAEPGGSGPYEPWHWEYVAGESTSSGTTS
jgi:D-alanyl-D-alanine carboxypeptidase